LWRGERLNATKWPQYSNEIAGNNAVLFQGSNVRQNCRNEVLFSFRMFQKKLSHWIFGIMHEVLILNWFQQAKANSFAAWKWLKRWDVARAQLLPGNDNGLQTLSGWTVCTLHDCTTAQAIFCHVDSLLQGGCGCLIEHWYSDTWVPAAAELGS
jgi:hypothetical protein